MMKYNKLDRNLVPKILGTGKVKIQLPADLMFDESCEFLSLKWHNLTYLVEEAWGFS
jgi:hypothetical protein